MRFVSTYHKLDIGCTLKNETFIVEFQGVFYNRRLFLFFGGFYETVVSNDKGRGFRKP